MCLFFCSHCPHSGGWLFAMFASMSCCHLLIESVTGAWFEPTMQQDDILVSQMSKGKKRGAMGKEK
jgi:hypothetical protein